jgi:outer membrane protein assembly factor BamB
MALVLAASGCEAITGPSGNRELWSVRQFGAAVGTPLVTEDLVISGVRDSNVVYAVDRTTGDLVWQQALDLPPNAVGQRELVPSTEFHSWNEQVIVSAGWLYSLDCSTGEVIWSLTPPDDRPGRWAVIGDGTLFASGSYITVIDPDMGESIDNIYVGEVAFAPIYDDGALYFGARGVVGPAPGGYRLGEGHAMAVDVSSGAGILWQVLVPDNPPWKGGVTARGALTGDLFVVAGLNGRVYGIDRESGEVRWLHETATPIDGDVQVIDGVAVIGDENGLVQGLDPDTGEVLWENTQLLGTVTAIGRTDQHALVTQGRIRAIDAQGREIWGYGGYGWDEPTSEYTPVWADGVVYIASSVGLVAVPFP